MAEGPPGAVQAARARLDARIVDDWVATLPPDAAPRALAELRRRRREVPDRGMMATVGEFFSGLGATRGTTGGTATALLGLGLHYAIAFAMAAAFFIVSRYFRFLTRQPIIAGIAYGVLLYFIMNFIVLPLSALPQHAWKPTLPALTDLCSHMFFVGLPIALATRRARAG